MEGMAQEEADRRSPWLVALTLSETVDVTRRDFALSVAVTWPVRRQVWLAHERRQGAASGPVEPFAGGRRHANAAIAGMWAGQTTK